MAQAAFGGEGGEDGRQGVLDGGDGGAVAIEVVRRSRHLHVWVEALRGRAGLVVGADAKDGRATNPLATPLKGAQDGGATGAQDGGAVVGGGDGDGAASEPNGGGDGEEEPKDGEEAREAEAEEVES